MMHTANREAAFTALFAKLQTVPGMATCTRRLKHWNDVAPEATPALYMEHTGEVAQPVHGQPSRIVLEVNAWIYVMTDEQDVGPIINPILDALGNALEPNNSGEHTQTLGGIVHHCWIEGQTQIFEGDLGNECVAIVPIKLLVS